MALIECTECGKQVSSLAISCPNCGYPINLPQAKEQAPNKAQKASPPGSRKYKKLPNGFGSIKKYSGKRRKPYAAFPPTKEYSLKGAPLTPKAIGYYETWHDAYTALTEYNRNPFDTNAKPITFAELYKLWFDETYPAGSQKSTMKVSRSSYNKCTKLYDVPFAKIRVNDLQAVVDDSSLTYTNATYVKVLFSKLYKYACKHEVVEKNYASFVEVHQENNIESGEPFTQQELDLLWANSEDKTVQMILIMIYTGFRISAFETIKVNLDERILQGGVKTKAGKDRIVPIHDSIFEFIKNCDFSSFSTQQFRRGNFYPKMKELGIDMTESGKKRTPHDCRHTFSWLCDTYEINDFCKHLLMGHSLGNDVEKSVYGHRTLDQLRKEIDKIKVQPANR